jgi:AAA15 family ATPase/GTPase
MRINKLQLKNFKRFTDLTLEGIPAEAKLVLLIGANGSGKSSVFDFFHYVKLRQYKSYNNIGSNIDRGTLREYYRKIWEDDIEFELSFNQGEDVASFNIERNSAITSPNLARFIGRSSIRILPKLHNGGDPSKIENDSDSPEIFIDNDTRFINDAFTYIQDIDYALREPVFSGKSADTLKIFQDFIRPLNTSLINIFGGDETTTIQLIEFQSATPTTTTQLIFKKGTSRLPYDLLSHGEKQVVILLLNFIVRNKQYQDAIIFIDEMDCHLNTSLQYRLLEEIVTKWIPDSSQLWTASHALGFIDYAKKSDSAAILDLDSLNFDIPQTIRPEPKDNLEVYEIAVPKDIIAAILADKKLVVTENKNSALYNLALGEKSYLFLPANNNREVFLTIKGQNHLTGLRDRDFLRDDEITAIEKEFPNYKILRYYTFENYLYHPENLKELLGAAIDLEAYRQKITEQKNQHLLEIIGGIGTARTTYVEFKEGIKNDGIITSHIAALERNDFETFYPFFNMKNFDKSILNKHTYQQKDLVSTNWFRQQIESVLKGA